MNLPADFREFIALMIDANVKFVMIGGYAYNLYLNPRATGDIDFLIAKDDQNQRRLREVLIEFGFGSTLPAEDQKILMDQKVVMLGRAPFRIDLLTTIDGVSEAEVFDSSRRIEIDGLLVPVIEPELLLKNKSSTGREKDKPDVIELRRWLSAMKNEHEG